MLEILPQLSSKASLDKVYEALTWPERLANWWTQDTIAED